MKSEINKLKNEFKKLIEEEPADFGPELTEKINPIFQSKFLEIRNTKIFKDYWLEVFENDFDDIVERNPHLMVSSGAYLRKKTTNKEKIDAVYYTYKKDNEENMKKKFEDEQEFIYNVPYPENN